MSLRNVLAFLVAAQAVTADSSHPIYFRKIDAKAAKSGSLYKSLAVSGDGSLVNEQGFWFSHFTVGASKDLEILIDTGSSDAIMNPGIYQPSSSSKDQQRGFHIAYATTNPDGSGDLEASGEVYRDVIMQLGANLTVPNQAIGDIRDPTSTPTFPHDGLIGYAGAQGAALRANPFIFSLCESHTLSACRFGLSLRTDGTGQLHYGAVADTEFSGNLTTVQIDDYWAISGAVTVNGKAVGSELNDINIVTDSGTTVMFGPVSAVRQVYKAAGIKEVSNANGGIQGQYSCSKPPTIGFKLNGKVFNIDPKALAFKSEGDTCTSSLMGTSNFGSTWLIGQPFFQARYIDHNIDDKTMGFADLK